MSDNINIIGLVGFQELKDKLRTLEGKMQKKILQKALRVAGQRVLAEIVYNAPSRSGALVSSMAVRAFSNSKAGFFGVTIGVVDSTVYYASFVELGTQYESAQDFERGALNHNAAQIITTVGEELNRLLTPVAREL